MDPSWWASNLRLKAGALILVALSTLAFYELILTNPLPETPSPDGATIQAPQDAAGRDGSGRSPSAVRSHRSRGS